MNEFSLFFYNTLEQILKHLIYENMSLMKE